MEYTKIKSADELPAILGIPQPALKRWFKSYPFGKHADCTHIKNRLLVGKPVIATFMGISEKTLKRWFVKYPNLPIERTRYRCYALTNNLMLWKVYREIEKAKPAHLAAAQDRLVTNYANMSGVTKRHYLDHYIRPYYPEHMLLKFKKPRARCYSNTVTKALKLLYLSRALLDTSGDYEWYRILYNLSPPVVTLK